VALRVTEQPTDTGTAAGNARRVPRHGGGVHRCSRLIFRASVSERKMEGIAAAKARGGYTGRKARTDPATVRRLHGEQRPDR
jgi:hypothetical protein